MDVLWRDRAPAAAANNLHQAVHVARRALDAGAIEVRDEVLQLTAEVDVDRLELAAADARRAGTRSAYRAALSLYGGELLPENRYDDWAEERREELAELAAELAEELAALGSGAAYAPPPLPADASSFIGRGRELGRAGGAAARDADADPRRHRRRGQDAARARAGPRRRAVAPGRRGVRRARRARRRAARPRRDRGRARRAGAVRADASSTRSSTSSRRARCCSSWTTASTCSRQRRRSRTRCCSSAPQLTILATSREPLRVPGEVVFRVPSLDIPDPEQALEPSELLRLREPCGCSSSGRSAAAPGFVLDERNAVDVARICFRLDGLPLALELAAGRLGALGPAAIAERLDDRFRVLRTGSHASPTRQQTLTATLQWSHDLLAPDERHAVPAARGLRRRLRARGGRERVRRAATSTRSDIADVLARLVEKSLVTADETSVPRAPLPPAGDRSPLRARAARRGRRDRRAGRPARPLGARARPRRSAARRGSTATPRTCASALDTLLERAPPDALRLCVALWPFWLRRIDLHEAQRRFDETLARRPGAHGTSRAGAARRGGDRLPQRCALPRAPARRGELRRRVPRSATRAPSGGRSSSWGSSASRATRSTSRCRGFERALELARRERFAAEEAICVYSLGVAHWILGDLARAEELVARSIEAFRALAGSPGADPVAGQHRRDPVASAGRPARAARRLRGHAAAVRRDLLRRRGQLRARKPGRDRARPRRPRASARAARRERRTVRGLRRRAAARRRCSSGARTSSSPRVRFAAARAALEQALELRRGQRDRRGLGLVLAGLGLIDTTAGDYDSAERAPRRGPRHLPARRRPLGAREHALADGRPRVRARRASTTPRPRCRRPARCSARRSGSAGSRTRSPGSPRSRCSAATASGPCALLAEARDRYAARDDALGVADVEERLRGLR